MTNKLYNKEEVIEYIKEGKLLALAGDEKILSQLPKGNWVGGTIPYFMGAEGGVFSQELIYVNELTVSPENFSINSYTAPEVNNIISDSYDNGASIVIIPPFTDIHKEYAIQIPNNEGLFNNPIIGWIAGINLDSTDTPKTYNGKTGEVYTDRAVSIHFELPEDKIARLEITNIFTQSEDDTVIEFFNDGFNCTTCLINGQETNLAKYIAENNIDTKLPIISDYSGALINVSFQSIEDETVNFYAPVFKNRKYKFAESISDYVTSFNSKIKKVETKPEFSCNCILNFLYGELEGRIIDDVTGPITFGEIGYQLLNQTLTFLFIEDK